MTLDELKMLQALPLEIKILKTQHRIREWVNHFGFENVYVGFSGGKDSTVLLHIIQQMYPTIKVVFCDTGLEYPEVVSCVKAITDVEIIRPKMNFKDVIIKYGYPFIGKEIASAIHQARLNKINGKYSYRLARVNGTAINPKTGKLSQYNCSKYKPLLDVDFNISHKCCDVMKKKPFSTIKRKPITGVMASESRMRKSHYLKTGCNAFESKKQSSTPLGFWTDQDILNYITISNLKIPSVYGDIINENGCMHCSGVNRTGCIFCGFGAQFDTQKGGTSRFELLRQTHPKLFDYCMRGGSMLMALGNLVIEG